MTKMKLSAKQIVLLIIIFLFVTLSFVFITPYTEKGQLLIHSSSLIKSVEKNNDQERTVYKDANGKICFADDLGYAIKTVTLLRDGTIEEYYDENETPITQSLGYHAILHQYDENGSEIRTTYLDCNKNPVCITYGYAIIKCEYEASAKIEYYYDENEVPVCSRDFGFGKMSEYNESSEVQKVTFLDKEGNPMVTDSGYAMMIRTYYSTDGPEQGKIKDEYYFDEEGKPTAIYLGNYGLHKEYNEKGQSYMIVYLNADGQVCMTNKGYAIVIRTFNNDNSVESEMYYDTTGKSVSLLEGQYGKKNIDGKEFFLDSNGKEQFNLKKIAYNYSFAAIVLVIVLTIVSTVSKRRGNLLLLILYIWIIGYITLFFRETNSQQVNLKLFSTYKYILIDSNIRSGIFRNIWLFIPLGVILYNIYPKKIVLIIPFAFSALIETIQYFMSIGWFELDDILNNMIGGCIGYYTARLLRAFDLKLASITSQNVIDETVDHRSEGRRTFERTGDQ